MRPLAALLMLAPAAAFAKTVTFDPENDRRPVRLDPGDRLEVELRASAGTAYRWRLSRPDQTGRLASEGVRTRSAGGRLGGPTISTFAFRAVGRGEATMVFDLTDGRSTPADRATVEAVVSGRPDPGDGIFRGRTLTERDDDRRYLLRVGDSIRVELTANPTTGYVWRAAPGTPGPRLRVVSAGMVAKPAPFSPGAGGALRPPVGRPGFWRTELRALRRGVVRLRYEYERPWENRPVRAWDVVLEIR